MPDRRRHRGPHPDDARLFAAENWPTLRAACDDLCWLLSRGYAAPSSIKLVGDRYALARRQRIAVARCACSDEAAERRRRTEISPDDLCGRELWVDGYNVLTTIEAALSGGVVLGARDGCYRDLASMHGSYHRVAETVIAVMLLGECLEECGPSSARWLLDQPVSNSGRLKTFLLELADESGWNWTVDLVPNPDTLLAETEHVVATADSGVLDLCGCWVNLARLTVTERMLNARVVDLGCDVF